MTNDEGLGTEGSGLRTAGRPSVPNTQPSVRAADPEPLGAAPRERTSVDKGVVLLPAVGPADLSPILVGALTVMGGLLASKLLGLVRNVVISNQYGASREYEIFLAAVSMPDLVFQVLAGGAVGAAFIPVFTEYLRESERRRAWLLTSGLMNLAVLVLGGVAIPLAILAPLATSALVPGWSPEDQARTAGLTRIMLVSPAIFAISTLATSALNGVRRFALGAAAPLMYNLSLIGAALLFRPLGADALAGGAIVGALLHLGIQVPGLVRVGMRYTPTLALHLAGTREVGRLMLPRAIGLGVTQLNQLVNIALASFLVAGSIAYLNYAWMILMVPLGVVAMGVSTAVFPTLADQRAASQTEEERRTFLFAGRLILYLTVPSVVVLIALGHPVVALLFQRGEFTAGDAAATAYTLAWFAIGLPGHAWIEIADRVFYADRDTATPVRVAATAVAVNLALGLLLMRTPLSYGGLALANSLAALLEAATLTTLLLRRTRWGTAELLGFGGRVAFAGAVMAAVALSLQHLLGGYVDPGHWTGQAALILGAGGGALALYVGSCRALGVDDGPRAIALLLRRA